MTQQPPDEQRVVAAARAWIYVPDDARTLETDEYLLIRYADWFAPPLEVVRFAPTRPVDVVLDEAFERARELEAPTADVWVGLAAPPGLEDRLQALGGEREETVDVPALDLAGRRPEVSEDTVEMRWQTDMATTRDNHEINMRVFGGQMPSDERLAQIAAKGAESVRVGRAGTLVAYVDGNPVGSAGVQIVDGVARLYAGAVLEEYRGRGIYRALLGWRLRFAVDNGATLALVKGRVETSGPILRRAGFAPFGQERSYRLAL